MKKKFWTAEKSVSLSIGVTAFVSVLLLILLVVAVPLFHRYCESMGRRDNFYQVFSVFFYICCPPAIGALYSLMKLLLNIRAGNIFVMANVNLLRYLSWCCFIVVPIAVVGGFYIFSSFFAAAAAAFMGLILRVLKNVMAAATEIKAENDFTV